MGTKHGRHQILYLNYETQERECSVCHRIKGFDHFGLNTGRTPRETCYPCRSVKVGLMEKKMDKHPWRFYQCSNEECNWIWVKLRGVTCPKCNSEHDKDLVFKKEDALDWQK
jgi:formate dehydrogenase maturation protein FdhE